MSTIARLNSNSVTAARAALIATLVSMLFSTSLSIGMEIAAYALFAASPALRGRLWHAAKHPAALALAAFLLTIVVGALHGAAPWETRLASLVGWRKALLFIFALAVFDTETAKKDLLSAFLAANLAAALLSTLTFFTQQTILGRSPGIVLHNDVTQSMMFVVASTVAAGALAYRAKVAAAWFPSSPLLLVAALVILIGNIAFVTPSRSGYLALIILAGVFSCALWAPAGKYRLVAALASVICVGVLLASSSQVRTRLTQAVVELRAGGDSQGMTSMGVRTIMWRNAYQLIKTHPYAGVGTGGFETAYSALVKDKEGWLATTTTDPHNQFLKVWAEQGMAGLLALLGFIGTVLISKALPPYRLFAVGVILVWCATSLFSSHFSTFVEGRFLFLWLGAMLAQSARDVPYTNETSSSSR